MTRKNDCIFCKICLGEIPASVLFENEYGLAFLDINPLAEGHVLFIPRDHYERLSEVPASLVGQLAAAIPLLGRALLSVTGVDAYNVLINEGAAAGQVVPHVHLHLIPRKTGDGLGYRWNAGAYGPGRADELAQEYRETLHNL